MDELGIRIYWGPWGGELDPSPLVKVGRAWDASMPDAPSLVDEDRVWMIANKPVCSFYSFYLKVPRTHGDGFMQVMVCLMIPEGQHLASQSPLTLLDALWELFNRLFTIDDSAKRPTKEVVDTAYIQLLADYPLEKCLWYVFRMEGTEPASFCVESRAQLDALMRFNAYPALANVKHLELGFNCSSTLNIDTKGNDGNVKKEPKRSWWKRERPKKQPKKKEKSKTIHREEESKTQPLESPIEVEPEVVVEPEMLIHIEPVDPTSSNFISNEGMAHEEDAADALKKQDGGSKKKKKKKTYIGVIIASCFVLGIFFAIIFTHYRELKKAETEAFDDCVSLEKCQEYLEKYPDGAHRRQVENLIKWYETQDSIAENERMEYRAYMRCMDAYDYREAIDRCDDYLSQYQDGYYWYDVMQRKNEMLEEGRRDALRMLNQGRKTDFEANAESFITEMEFGIACWFLESDSQKVQDIMDVYEIDEDDYYVYDANEDAIYRSDIKTELENAIANSVEPYLTFEGFCFSSWEDVSVAFYEILNSCGHVLDEYKTNH